jgi:hypothetical protein
MQLSEIQDHFSDKIKAGIFRPIMRHLPGNVAADRLQDALGLTWRLYREHAERGDVLEDALLVHACRRRAVDLQRHVVPFTDRKRDVLAGASRNPEIELVAFDESCGWAHPWATNPSVNLISALDLERWLKALGPDDRLLVQRRAAGQGLKEIADELGRSTSCIFSRLCRLGRELAAYAEIPVPKRRQRPRHRRRERLAA